MREILSLSGLPAACRFRVRRWVGLGWQGVRLHLLAGACAEGSIRLKFAATSCREIYGSHVDRALRLGWAGGPAAWENFYAGMGGRFDRRPALNADANMVPDGGEHDRSRCRRIWRSREATRAVLETCQGTGSAPVPGSVFAMGSRNGVEVESR